MQNAGQNTVLDLLKHGFVVRDDQHLHEGGDMLIGCSVIGSEHRGLEESAKDAGKKMV